MGVYVDLSGAPNQRPLFGKSAKDALDGGDDLCISHSETARSVSGYLTHAF